MSKKKIDKNEYEKIIQLRNDGHSIKDIANIFNVSSSRIGQILRCNGINTVNPRYLQFSYDDVLKMYDMYVSGVSRIDIAKIYGICADSVYNLFLKYNFSVNSMSHAKQQYNINEYYFDEIDTSNKAYILGLLYADGCNMTNRNEIILSLQEQDKHILEQIKCEIEYDGPLKFIDYNSKNKNHKNQYKLDITNKHMSKTLNNLGVWKNKSLILEWPSCLNEKLYSHFIRGYFDGDGCLYFANGSCNATVSFVGTEMFLNKLSDIIKEKLDVDLYVRDTGFKHNFITKEAKMHSLNSVLTFLNWIYENADLMLMRKYNKYQQLLNNINNSRCA